MTPPRLLACTPPSGSVDPDAVLRWRDAGAIEVGLALWLREPGASPRELVVGRLRPLVMRARAAGLPILLGIDASAIGEAAVVVDAEGLAGVQLRADPDRGALERVRERLSGALVGRSSHDAGAADHDLVDFTCFGPVFDPRTRVAGDDKRAQGIAALGRIAGAPRAWVLALGGVDASHAGACVQAGARGVAGISAFFGEGPDELAALVRALG